MNLALEDAAALTGGMLAGRAGVVASGVSIDSRTLAAGDLFFAIVGSHHDGHRFVSDAIARGAAGVVASQPVDSGGALSPPVVGGGAPTTNSGDVPVIRVPDTTIALQELAHAVRVRAPLLVVAVTGSMGKTTTKEATAAALSARFSVLKSEGNLNNLFGLPLSLLRYEREDAAVLEMGMSAPGEIARLTEIARPDVGVLTNVAEVHREFFPSLQAIADAKGELLAGLRETAVAVLNADDPLVMSQVRRFLGRKLSFGLGVTAEIRASAVERTETGMRFDAQEGDVKVAVETRLVGRHNVYNLLAALGAARALGIPLAEASLPLRALGPTSGRGARERFQEGFLVIDETYNSNPKALAAALESLKNEIAGRRIAVLGDMRELGERAEVLHREAGKAVVENGVDLLIGVGALGRLIVEGARNAGMPDESLLLAETPEAAGELMGGRVRKGDVVLFKASRGVALEKALGALHARFHAHGRGG